MHNKTPQDNVRVGDMVWFIPHPSWKAFARPAMVWGKGDREGTIDLWLIIPNYDSDGRPCHFVGQVYRQHETETSNHQWCFMDEAVRPIVWEAEN